MADTFGEALRSLRDAAGMTQAQLAVRVHISVPHLCNIENNVKPATAQLSAAFDRVLGCLPLLTTLAAMGGDDVKRRALLTHIRGAAALGAVAGPGGLAELVRAGLLDGVGLDEDWDAVVADYRHRLTVDGSAQFGASMLTRLMVARQQLVERQSPELLRAVAALGQIYGLWLGNVGDLPAAHGWYRTAGALAGRSGDQRLTSFVIGRSASRGIYEGWTVARTMADSQRALQLAGGRPWDGALEAFAAQVHVHALTGDAAAGRVAAQAMTDVAVQSGSQSALARALFSGAFAECRYGTPASAQAAYEGCRDILRAHPLWLAELKVYLGRSLVAAGDVTNGVGLALSAVQSLSDDVRVVAVAVRDVVCSAPEGSARHLEPLRQYADKTPGPWETLR